MLPQRRLIKLCTNENNAVTAQIRQQCAICIIRPRCSLAVLKWRECDVWKTIKNSVQMHSAQDIGGWNTLSEPRYDSKFMRKGESSLSCRDEIVDIYSVYTPPR